MIEKLPSFDKFTLARYDEEDAAVRNEALSILFEKTNEIIDEINKDEKTTPKRYGIKFSCFEDYKSGLAAASKCSGSIGCKPDRVLIINKEQLDEIEKQQIMYTDFWSV